jgi:lipopolysaccharide transport system ATP-binding protein
VAFASSPIREPEWHGKPLPLGLFRSACEIPGDLLNDGSYHLQLEFRLNEGMIVYSDDALLTMEVIDDVSARGAQHCAWPGTVRPQLAWTTKLLDPVVPAPAV